MATLASQYDPVAAAFEKAKHDFEANLKDPVLYKDILQTTTIDQVYDFTDKLQQDQANTNRLRYLGKIQPFLEGLREYQGVVEQFVQVKPDLLAVIWDPIKLLLQWTHNLQKPFDEIVKVTGSIGDALPQFTEMTRIFSSNDRIKDLLLLFFKDILSFYQIAFEFFTKKAWKLVLEAAWPRYKKRLEILVEHIQRHSMLMREEVTLQNIREEHEARQKALDHYDEETKFRLRRDFDALQAKIKPRMYYEYFSRIREKNCAGTSEWLERNANFLEWRNVSSSTSSVLWLQGIPGSGKTFLSSSIVGLDASSKTLYAFLSHIHAGTTALSVLHALLFQLGEESDDVKAVVNACNLRDLQSSTEYATKTLSDALKIESPLYIVLDGLDEIGEGDRQALLRRLCAVATEEPLCRLLISCRNEEDIGRALKTKALNISVDSKNTDSIEVYVKVRTAEWFHTRDFDQESQRTISKLLVPLASKAKGMFLYARIVLDNIKMLYDVESIKQDLRALPEDLNEAYGRIFARIDTLPPRLQVQARKALGWIGCCEEPMSIQELEQAMLISPENGSPQVTGQAPLLALCGPIVEIVNDVAQFVHFTVKEYIFSTQIQGHISMRDATASLLTACLNHLCSSVFEEGIEATELRDNILSGLTDLHASQNESG
ncbi:NACHT domain protein [Thozetella sp. PMI_491]|nr:NACHT domain protein [Thozetella sp. PMI_491]